MPFDANYWGRRKSNIGFDASGDLELRDTVFEPAPAFIPPKALE
jgi:hypothetical protein